MSNSFGKIFKITTYGESHGVGVGVIIDGCPAGVKVDEALIQAEMQRRKPGQSKITTQRKEEDVVEILSGVFDGMTTGTPVALAIRNTNQKSKDYAHIKDSFRPSHADFTYQEKYGVRDYRGGGRSSARETAARVAAGAIAKMYAQKAGVKVQAYVSQVGSLKLDKSYQEMDLDKAEENIVRCPDPQTAEQMIQHIDETRKNRDTIGGIVSCVITGTPVGLGEPVFDKLHAILGQAMLSINAVKGFEYGSGFEGVKMYGLEHNDPFKSEDGKVETTTNHSGGVQGGISNGQDIYFNVAFKPIATIMNDQESIDKDGNTIVVEGKGRHDPCVVPRAVPIVEAMTALTIADFMLRAKTNKI